MSDWKDDDEVTTTFGSIRQGMAEAAEAERKRIIALLEATLLERPDYAPCQPLEGGWHYLQIVENTLALIKGENK